MTMICLSSWWPETTPLRKGTASEVAEGLVTTFIRTGLSLKLLTNQDTVFVSKVIKQLCEIFGVDKVQTTAYHPQSNGILEQFHGTLKPILAKAVHKGLDWVTFLPTALFSIRQAVNRDMGFPSLN